MTQHSIHQLRKALYHEGMGPDFVSIFWPSGIRSLVVASARLLNILTDRIPLCGSGFFQRLTRLLPRLKPAFDEPDVDVLLAKFLLYRSADRASAHAVDHHLAAPEVLTPLRRLLGVLPLRSRDAGGITCAVGCPPHINDLRRVLSFQHYLQFIRSYCVPHRPSFLKAAACTSLT